MAILIVLLVSGLYAKDFSFVLENIRNAEYTVYNVTNGKLKRVITDDFRRHISRTNEGFIHHSFINKSVRSSSFLSSNFYTKKWSKVTERKIGGYSSIDFVSFTEFIKVVNFKSVNFVSFDDISSNENNLIKLDIIDDQVNIQIGDSNVKLIKTCSNVYGNFNITEASISKNKKYLSFEVYDTMCPSNHRQRFFVVDLVSKKVHTIYSEKKKEMMQALPADGKWISDTEILFTDEEDDISLINFNHIEGNRKKLVEDVRSGFIVSDFKSTGEILLVNLGPDGQKICEYSIKSNKLSVLFEVSWWLKFKYFFSGYRLLDPVY